MCLGLFEIISGYVIGKLADKVSKYRLCTAATLCAEAALVISLLTFYIQSYPACFICSALWGFTDCFFNNIVSIVCSEDYKGKMEIFALYRFFLALCGSIVLAMNMILNAADAPSWIFMIVIVIL